MLCFVVIVVVVVVVVVEEVVVDLIFCGVGLVSKVVSLEDFFCIFVNIKKIIIVEVGRILIYMLLIFMYYKINIFIFILV